MTRAPLSQESRCVWRSMAELLRVLQRMREMRERCRGSDVALNTELWNLKVQNGRAR